MQHVLIDWMPLWIPLAVLVITQFIKVLLDIPEHGFQLRQMNSYGGMPSTHTALCASIAIIIGLVESFRSPLFALAAVTAMIVVRDAVGIRWELGYHARMLNHLIHLLPKERQRTFPKHLEERLGHRPIEALAGGIIGTLLTVMLYVITVG